MPISTHNSREFWGQNFYRHSANLILFVTFTFLWNDVSKKRKSHVFLNLKKNIKYVFSNTGYNVQCAEPVVSICHVAGHLDILANDAPVVLTAELAVGHCLWLTDVTVCVYCVYVSCILLLLLLLLLLGNDKVCTSPVIAAQSLDCCVCLSCSTCCLPPPPMQTVPRHWCLCFRLSVSLWVRPYVSEPIVVSLMVRLYVCVVVLVQ